MPKQINKILAEIAKKHMNIETLETRNADSLDFHDVAVWGVKDALKSAYEAGQTATHPNERLLRSSLAHEVYRGDMATTTTICKTLHEMGWADSPDYSSSTAMCFEESEPTPAEIITVLNAIGYDL